MDSHEHPILTLKTLVSTMPTRRNFLLVSASAGLALAAAPVLVHAAKDEKKPFAGFSIGLQSYSLRKFKTDEAIKHAKEIGFEHIEFYSGQFPVDSTPEQIDAFKDKIKGLGLKMYSHGVNRFTKDHDANRKLFEFAKRAGLRNITADPSPDSFESLDSLVAEYDIRISIHNHGPGHRYNKAVDVVNAVKAHDPRIGACADLGHYIRSGEDSVEVIKLLGDRLFGIHLKDFAEQDNKFKGVILGKGRLDVLGVFRALRQVNFPADGCLSLEYEENPDAPLDDVRECLAIAKDAAAKAMA
jgi:inosose dehydratase